MRYAQESFKGKDGSTVRGAWVGSKWISEYHLREIATHAEEIINAGYGSDDSTPTKVKKVKTVKSVVKSDTSSDLSKVVTMIEQIATRLGSLEDQLK